MQSLHREALELYRDALRTARYFRWAHPSGVTWSEILLRSIREEFEAARNERDPHDISRMIVSGRAALLETQNRIRERQRSLLDEDRAERS